MREEVQARKLSLAFHFSIPTSVDPPRADAVGCGEHGDRASYPGQGRERCRPLGRNVEREPSGCLVSARTQWPDDSPDRAREHRRHPGARAPFQRLRCGSTADRRGARRPAQHGSLGRPWLGPRADFQRIGVDDDPRWRAGNQRPGKSQGARARRPRGQHLRSRQAARGDRAFARVADDLYLFCRRLQRRRLTANGDHDRVLLLPDRRRSGRLHDGQGDRHAR